MKKFPSLVKLAHKEEISQWLAKSKQKIFETLHNNVWEEGMGMQNREKYYRLAASAVFKNITQIEEYVNHRIGILLSQKSTKTLNHHQSGLAAILGQYPILETEAEANSIS